jgi:hypothetical protein
MRNIDFLEFGPPEDFTDLFDIVKWQEEQDQVWKIEIS